MKNKICICQPVQQISAINLHVQTIEAESKHSLEIKLDETKKKNLFFLCRSCKNLTLISLTFELLKTSELICKICKKLQNCKCKCTSLLKLF